MPSSKSSLNILQVVPYFAPAWDYGGPVRVCYELSRQLVKRGHEVTVYTTDALNARSRVIEREETLDGIRVRRFRNLSNTVAYRHNIFVSPGMLTAMAGLAGFDVIHLHEYRTLQNTLVHYHAVKLRVPYILQARGSLPIARPKKSLKRLYDSLWGHRILNDAARVIALTPTEAEQYGSMGLAEDKVEVVPNGIDLSEFENLPERGEFRRRWGIGDNERLVLYLGRIHEIKGLDVLAKAFAELLKAFNNIKLAIAGPDDGYLPTLKKLIEALGIEEHVIFTGLLHGRDKLAAYVDADIYVLPSFYEIFGNTVIEACACGTPVIVTDRCGIASVIDGQAGLVVPYDKDHLGNAILHMLGDDEMRRRFGEKGRLLVREQFAWSRIIAQVESIYGSCVSSKHQIPATRE